MQLAKEFYGELSNVCQVKALPGSVPQNNPPRLLPLLGAAQLQTRWRSSTLVLPRNPQSVGKKVGAHCPQVVWTLAGNTTY